MSGGRIIDGAIFDAEAEAAAIRHAAQREADTIRDDARREAEAILAAAGADAFPRGAGLDPARGGLGDASTELDPDAPVVGKVTEVTGLVVRADVPGLVLGELVHIERHGPRGGPRSASLAAEVVGFRGDQAVLLPLGELTGVAPSSTVVRSGAPLAIRAGDALLGRVLDGLGRPVDGGPPIAGEAWAVDREAPRPLDRPAISQPFATGVRAVDGFATLGLGQRIGVFAGSGVGKSTLLGQIASGADADVVVVGLIGERGRELGDFLAGPLAAARAKTVVVCATADAPSLVRLRAAHVATAVAEWFRDRRGARVLLVVDSLTRVARAQREVGLSAGEPPARHGYPPSVFAMLPRLVERAGNAPRGSITAVYTVLVAGGDLDEPIADEVRGIVDGHLVLDRRLAARGHFPPIDVVASISRVMNHVTGDAHRAAAAASRRRLAIYEEHRDLITLGAYKAGADRALDDAVAHISELERFLRQGPNEHDELPKTVAKLTAISR
jgi:ATP synthase in type III secretion protein N